LEIAGAVISWTIFTLLKAANLAIRRTFFSNWIAESGKVQSKAIPQELT
jgi:hypothetical protein